MNPRKLNVVRTDVNDLTDIVSKVVDDRFKVRDDKRTKERQIDKVLKRDVMLDEKKKLDKTGKSSKHVHTCPSCQAKLKSDGKNYEVCEGCGDTVVTFKKDEKILVCSSCGNAVSQSSPKCSNCGSTKAHWLK